MKPIQKTHYSPLKLVKLLKWQLAMKHGRQGGPPKALIMSDMMIVDSWLDGAISCINERKSEGVIVNDESAA